MACHGHRDSAGVALTETANKFPTAKRKEPVSWAGKKYHHEAGKHPAMPIQNKTAAREYARQRREGMTVHQHTLYLAEAILRSAKRRALFTSAERAAYLKYLSEYQKAHRPHINLMRKRWRAQQSLAAALGTTDEASIIKFRAKLAMLKDLINVPQMW